MLKSVNRIAKIALSAVAIGAVCAAIPAVNRAAAINVQAQEARVDGLEAYLQNPVAPQSVLSFSREILPELRDDVALSDLRPLDPSVIQQARFQADEKYCLAQAVYYESRSESRAGQRAVAEVILNRVSSKHFPDTICGVVNEGADRQTGCQFSFMCDGSLSAKINARPWKRSEKVAEHMMLGAYRPITQGATHYHTHWVQPVWAASLKPTRYVGDHEFYRFKNRREIREEMAVAP